MKHIFSWTEMFLDTAVACHVFNESPSLTFKGPCILIYSYNKYSLIINVFL